MPSLFEAAQAGDAAAIRSILDAQPPAPDAPAAAPDQAQEHASNDADASASAPVVDVNAKDAAGFSPLVLAARGGHEDAVRELLARGELAVCSASRVRSIDPAMLPDQH